jgi:sporulation protein YlmC with PRC-barrel domain
MMPSVIKRVLAVSLFVLPIAIAEQTPADQTSPGVTQSAGGSDTYSQTATPPLTQTTQAATSPAPASTEGAVSVKSLLDAKVFDSANNEIGTLRSVLADPQTGKLVRADIALKGGGVLKSDQQFSVPWEQLSVKRQEGNFIVVLKQETIEKLQKSEKQGSSRKQDGQMQQNK